MNIFKVLASSLDTFRETQVSVMLAWLLNPNMEHGLEFVFLKKVLHKIITDKKLLDELDNILRPILRSGRHKEKQNIEIDIEYDVGTSRPDIVVFINNKYVFSIENKIYSTSIESEGNELKRQYDGLKEKCKDFKIL